MNEICEECGWYGNYCDGNSPYCEHGKKDEK